MSLIDGAIPVIGVQDPTQPWAPEADLIGVDVPRRLWLAMRRRGLGGSDASAVWGINPYRSAWQLWVEKSGLAAGDDTESEAALWGRTLEGPVAVVAAERNNLKIREWGAMMFQSRLRPWQLANPDRLVVEPGGTVAGVEIKTTSLWLADQWDGDELPAAALLQATHCMAVLGTPAWWVCGLIGGQRLACQRIERDPELESLLNDAEQSFWRRVVDGDPPTVDGTAATTEALSAWYWPSDPDLVVTLDAAQLGVVRSLTEAKAEVKAAERVRDELANQVRDLLGHAEIAVGSDGLVAATWKQQADRRVAVPAEFVARAMKQRRPADIGTINLRAPGNRPLITKKV